jgi:hypothetical protein
MQRTARSTAPSGGGAASVAELRGVGLIRCGGFLAAFLHNPADVLPRETGRLNDVPLRDAGVRCLNDQSHDFETPLLSQPVAAGRGAQTIEFPGHGTEYYAQLGGLIALPHRVAPLRSLCTPTHVAYSTGRTSWRQYRAATYLNLFTSANGVAA